MRITLSKGLNATVEVEISEEATVQELREKVAEFVNPKFEEFRSFHFAGRNLSTLPADQKLRLMEGVTVHVFTTPYVKAGAFVELAKRESNVGNICHLKPVATPHSGAFPSTLRTNWNRYSEKIKAKILAKLSTPETGTVQVYLPPEDKEGLRNIFVFYSQEHLEQLALCSEKTVDELLDIATSTRPDTDEEAMSLIYLMFGDAVGIGCCPDAQLTRRAQEILNLFMDMH